MTEKTLTILLGKKEYLEKQANDYAQAGISVCLFPEGNEFPMDQISIVHNLVAKFNGGDTDIVLITNSPYVLTTLNNCIQAHTVFQHLPEKEEEITAVLPKTCWLDYECVKCSYVEKEDVFIPAMDADNQLINASMIDGASDYVQDQLNKLLDFIYP